MARLATSFVLGFHGCDSKVADELVNRKVSIEQSDEDHDWLGPGAYFWEGDPKRAMEFAEWKKRRGKIDKATVVGAVIDLGNCLDLTTRGGIQMMQRSHHALMELLEKDKSPKIPENKNVPGDPFQNLLLRFLDCAVIRHLHKDIDELASQNPSVEKIDTVRALFEEGGEIYPGAGIKDKNHTQIAVRNNACIKGFFYPMDSTS